MNKLFGVTPKDLEQAADLLLSGEIVALPTETVYGLAALALNERAVEKIFAAKRRPANDPLIIHVANAVSLRGVCRPDERALALTEAFWPGPLTLVLPKKQCVPGLVTSGLDTVAVRSPCHPVFREILQRVNSPLAAPSANLFGKVSPTTARHVVESFGANHPPVVDGGNTEHGVESTILDLSGSTPAILRPGPITPGEIEHILGERPDLSDKREVSADAPAASPGLLSSHYRTEAPIRLFPDLPALLDHARRTPPPPGTRLITGKPPKHSQRLRTDLVVLTLSETGAAKEIARNLFAVLRRADAASPPLILAHLVEETGLGRAVNDRLRRAARVS